MRHRKPMKVGINTQESTKAKFQLGLSEHKNYKYKTFI